MLYNLLLRDVVEIFFYSTCIYAFCTWLKADKTKNILIYFLAYCTLTIVAWVTQLPTLSSFLFAYAPIMLLLFIILHEKTLQRNLVTLCAITPAHTDQENWLDTIISSSLALINANKSITVIIERKDALEYFLITPFFINADISKQVLEIFFSSPSYNEEKMVWITSNGKIRSLNSSWNTQQEKMGDAFFYTLQSDAIVFSTNPINRTFTLISNAQEIKNLSAQHLHSTIKKQLSHNNLSFRKGAYHEKSGTEKSIF